MDNYVPDDLSVRLGRDRNRDTRWLSVDLWSNGGASWSPFTVQLTEEEFAYIWARLLAVRSMGEVIRQRAEYSAENPDPF